MSAHWSVLMGRARSVLVRNGAEVEQERDYLIATWTVAPGSRRDATFRVIIGPGRHGEAPDVEEVDLEGLYQLSSEAALRAVAPVLTSCVAALDEIATLHKEALAAVSAERERLRVVVQCQDGGADDA